MKAVSKNRKRLGSLALDSRMIMIGGIALAVLVVFIFVGRLISVNRHSDASNPDIQLGIDYLTRLENRDSATIQDKINAIKKEERRAALENGEVSVWSMFYDYCVLGDSRAVGFYFYNYLDESRVLAEAGNTIHDIPDRIAQLQTINPSNVYLCYGINDVSIGYYPTAEVYAEEMDKSVQMIQEALPNATIYINSIFPAQDPAFELSTDWYNIPDYNVAVKAMCEQKGYHYVDNNPVFEAHKDLYDIDGIHFLPSLYDYWGANMIAEMDA